MYGGITGADVTANGSQSSLVGVTDVAVRRRGPACGGWSTRGLRLNGSVRGRDGCESGTTAVGGGKPQSLAFVVAFQPLSHLEVEVVVRYAA